MTSKLILDYARANFGQQQDRNDDAQTDDSNGDLSSDPIPMSDLPQPKTPKGREKLITSYIAVK